MTKPGCSTDIISSQTTQRSGARSKAASDWTASLLLAAVFCWIALSAVTAVAKPAGEATTGQQQELGQVEPGQHAANTAASNDALGPDVSEGAAASAQALQPGQPSPSEQTEPALSTGTAANAAPRRN
ncbi:MAG: hypothetical protein AAGG72_07505, partial [Pseudomonadota bacterium]